jgi:putative DNA primase/helicase
VGFKLATLTDTESALSRLRTLIESAKRNPESTTAWQTYTATLEQDVAELCRSGSGPETLLIQLAAVGGKGSGWSGKANSIRGLLAQARRLGRTDDNPTTLDLDTDGRPRKTLSNIERVLSSDPTWVGQIKLNELSDKVEIGGKSTSDAKVTEVAIHLDRTNGLAVEEGMTGRVLRLVGERNAYHPVREYLTGLAWDGVRRVENLLGEYLEAATPDGEQRVPGDEGSPLLEALSRRWMISAVARAMQPGCKVDTVLILQGRQGDFKGTAIRTLGGADWVRSSKLEIGDKDVYQQIRGAWIYEIQEIDGMLTRKHSADLKAFVSEHKDSYRRPYGHDVEDVFRGCVFVGTVNTEAIFADPTGSRRFWPVRVQREINYARIAADRDQLWAEAMDLYRKGTPWHLTDDEEASLVEASDTFQVVDPWEGYVQGYVAQNREDFTTSELLQGIGITVDKQGDAAEARVRRILTTMGFHSKRKRTGDGVRTFRWFRRP